MKHVKSLNKPMNSNLKKSGCGECQTHASQHVRHPAQ